MLHKQSQKGFSLIEAIVATALFAVTVLSIIGVYLSTVGINRRTDVIRTASENARYLNTYLTKEIRNGQIDYYGPVKSPCSTTLSPSANWLAIINSDGDHLCFYLGDFSGGISSNGTNLWLIKNNFPSLKVNSNNVSIQNLTFYISPAINPYTAGTIIEPRVTFTANIQSTSGSQDSVIIPIESSVSIPAYDVAHP
ncbi:MAG: hypothetical protein NVSMB66_4090 [Candidatus Doudnabacteria bacterium]